MANEFAKGAYYVGAANDNSFQAFAVGCSTPEECLILLEDYTGLIGDAKLATGKQLHQKEIEALGLRPNEIKSLI
jgi:hypothetical protein